MGKQCDPSLIYEQVYGIAGKETRVEKEKDWVEQQLKKIDLSNL